MPVTENVIRDLLPVYAAGEASPDTRALVEEYLKTAPELKATIDSAATLEIPSAAPPPELGPRALQQTRDLLARKTFLTGFSFYFSTLPLAFLDRAWRIPLLPYRGCLIMATLCLLVGLGGWVAFFKTCRDLRATGLQPRIALGPALVWFLGTNAVCYVWAVIMEKWTGIHYWANFFLILPFFAIQLGQKLRQLPNPDEVAELARPLTLFHDPRDRRP